MIAPADATAGTRSERRSDGWRRIIQDALIAYAEDASRVREWSHRTARAQSSLRLSHMSTLAGLPDCEAVVRALWDYLDRELDETDLAAIDAHLLACEKCRVHAEFERRLIDEIRAVRAQHDTPDALRARVLAVLRRARLDGR